ncbi:D-tyrosyl-tRNA(Tyr) deacylase [Desulfocicer vacuolatum DSM 3385]|uniref:D-aminoacyl-tRNA deacylase n=1 Tax=Desulfocicer vacuolatum DSM 3385 TaxID=1121400 RepID=A0A1W1YLX3_9BACT|nr:D-aminoacyl-tRNA deacylase [Desulfocicer vacuolatum]SMC36728.1 D-tyrosyl-tRNA(Tyr) deacylase [Desulfocicer vacuolatum DSM 3385]
MRAVVQRVKNARVTVGGSATGEINRGLTVLLGVAGGDTQKEVDFLVEKIIHLRIFEDSDGKMNHSLMDIKGDLLVVSQFTLLGDVKKGRRPSFTQAAPPDEAKALYELFIEKARHMGINTQTGEFRAMMDVSLVNSGPVTLILDTATL